MVDFGQGFGTADESAKLGSPRVAIEEFSDLSEKIQAVGRIYRFSNMDECDTFLPYPHIPRITVPLRSYDEFLRDILYRERFNEAWETSEAPAIGDFAEEAQAYNLAKKKKKSNRGKQGSIGLRFIGSCSAKEER